MKSSLKNLSIKLYEEREVQALEKLVERHDGSINMAVREAIVFTSTHHELIEVLLNEGK